MSQDSDGGTCDQCGKPSDRTCKRCGRVDCGEHTRWIGLAKNQFAPLLSIDELCERCATRRVRLAYRGLLAVLAATVVVSALLQGKPLLIPAVWLPLAVLWWLNEARHPS